MFAYGIAGQPAALRRWASTRRSSATPRRSRCSRSPSTTPRSSPRPPDPAFANIPGDLRNRDQHWLTLGLRARVFQGLTLDAGVDVGLRSVGYEYGTPLPPYDVIFGLTYPVRHRRRSARPVVVTRTVEKVPAPTMGSVVGTVKSKADGKPIAEAVVSFSGQPRARVATDPDGSFESVPLPPGPADITVVAAGFEPATGKANVVAGSAATIEVALVAKDRERQRARPVADRAGRGDAGHAPLQRAEHVRGARRRERRVLGGAAGRTLPGHRRGAGLPEQGRAARRRRRARTGSSTSRCGPRTPT